MNTDQCKPLAQKPAPCRVLELYTGPAFVQVVCIDLYTYYHVKQRTMILIRYLLACFKSSSMNINKATNPCNEEENYSMGDCIKSFINKEQYEYLEDISLTKCNFLEI